MQRSRFLNVLDVMGKQVTRRANRVEGKLALAGILTRQAVVGRRRQGQPIEDAAQVFWSPKASIKFGKYLITTEEGSSANNSGSTSHFVYVPFEGPRGHNACVMRVKQLLLVKKPGMGWDKDEARLAVGIIYENMSVEKGAGVEVSFNDDPRRGAVSVPRILHATSARMAKGYPFAVHISQIHGPLVYLKGETGDRFITTHRMGFHGRKDLLLND